MALQTCALVYLQMRMDRLTIVTGVLIRDVRDPDSQINRLMNVFIFEHSIGRILTPAELGLVVKASTPEERNALYAVIH